MGQEDEDVEDERTCPVVQCLRKLGEDLKASDVGQHIRGVQREALLAFRSVLDVCIDQLGPEGEQDGASGGGAAGE